MAITEDQLMEWIAQVAPNPYAQAGLIIVLFYVIARLVNLFLGQILSRWLGKTSSILDDRLVGLLRRPVYVSIFITGLGMASHVLPLPESVQLLTVSVLKSVSIFIWSVFLIRLAGLLLDHFGSDKAGTSFIQDSTLPLFRNLSSIIITAFAIYMIFIAWGIDVTAWIASAGIMGIAISFAAKDTLANLFSGVFIVADAPYKIGDFIILDSGERGEVTHIGIRSTRLLTRDDVEITVPNSVMGNSKITNEAGGPHTKNRIRVKIGVAYGSDIDQVRAILEKVAQENTDICETPEPRVRFRSFGESGLDFELLGWISQPVLKGRVLDALNCAVYKMFLAENIEIPYPKRDLYIKEGKIGGA